MSFFEDFGSSNMMTTPSITHEGHRSYLNLEEPLDLTTASNTNSDQPNPVQPSFMKVFDINLVGTNPQEVPDKFIKGKHPEWLYVYGTYQFVEPQGSANSNKSIAFWDQYYNRPFFYGRGYLFRHPSKPGVYEWSFDPESQPFPENKKKGYEKTASGVILLFEDFDLPSAVKLARPAIRQIFESGTLDVPDDSARFRNTSMLKNWIADRVFDDEFGAKIGFSEETDSHDLWPAKSVLNIIIKKIELFSPGLTQKKVGDKIEALPIQEALARQFAEARKKKRNELKLPTKITGTT